MELVSMARKTLSSSPGFAGPAVREAAEAVAVMLSLYAPYTAEEIWEILGHQPPVARAGWPAVDPELLIQESVTCAIQVQGKVRDRLSVAPDVTADELERLALASARAGEIIGDRQIRKIIVRAPKLVNIVLA